MENSNHDMSKNVYKKFALMLIISFFIMYGAMFLNVEEVSHIFFSNTRIYMSLLMVAPMALLMLGLMRHMYKSRKLNTIIVAGSIVVFLSAFFMLRTQAFVGDEQYMQAMIPHHSSAIMTSRHADLRDPEVKELSEKIIQSQREEIAQMKAALERMD